MEQGSSNLNVHVNLLVPIPGSYKFLNDAVLNPWATSTRPCVSPHWKLHLKPLENSLYKVMGPTQRVCLTPETWDGAWKFPTNFCC